ncbi:hypothetical protein V7127_02455 [Bacillus sp. JJ1773]|uniref:hypothetical protein n=1 Tax=Bacillus sp. JJ1773 TaxID=3122965 RepID=UPI003000E847
MSAQIVFENMKSYYLATGQVMQNEEFVQRIASKFDTDKIIDGLMVFNKYLDDQRRQSP